MNKYYQTLMQCKCNYEKSKTKSNKNEKYLISSYYKHSQLVRLELLNKNFIGIIKKGDDEIFENNSIHYYCIIQFYLYFIRIKERYIFIPSNHLMNVFNKIMNEEILRYILIFIKNSIEMLERKRSCINYIIF